MARKHKRNKVDQQVANVSCYEIEGTIADVIKRLQALAQAHGEDARLDYGQHERWDDSYSFAVIVTRDETDSEYDERVKEIKAREAAFERREREEFERLTKKYAK